LKLDSPRLDFLTFEEFERLLEAVKDDPERRALFLVGGEAGLRQGESIALVWDDVDMVLRTMSMRESSWREIVTTPKSERDRKVPLTVRLASGLKAYQHLRGGLVFCHPDGSPLAHRRSGTPARVQARWASSDRLACPSSHLLFALAMRGAPPTSAPTVGERVSLGFSVGGSRR